MKKKSIALLLVVALMISVLAACGGSNGKTDETKKENKEATENNTASVELAETENTEKSTKSENEKLVGTTKIGLVAAVTGSNSLAGEEAIEGAKLAIKEINASGGVNGQEFELVITDEVDNLEMSVLATQELLTNDEISAICGSMYSTYAIATIPAVNAAEVPYFCAGASTGVSDEKSPWTWQARPLTSAGGKATADFVVNQLGCKNPAIMYSTQSTFMSLADEIVENLILDGIEIGDTNMFAFPEDESNYSPYISQVMAGDFDCLISVTNQIPAAVVCQQVEAAGLTPDMMPLVGSTSYCSAICIENAGSAADGWYSIADWVPGGFNATGAAFEEAYLAEYPSRQTSDLASVVYYDSIYLIAEAMKIAGTNTDRFAINEALREIDIEGAMSDFKYYDNHSFANTLAVTQNINQKPVAVDAITFR